MADLTLNTTYNLMNDLIRGTRSTNLDRKMLALNEGYKHLQNKTYQAGFGIEELLKTPTDITTTISTNFVSLPTDFATLDQLWYESGSEYILFDTNASLSFKELMQQIDQQYFDTGDTGIPSRFAIKRPYIYFDRHAAATSTTGIKISYWARPATLVAYDRLTVSAASGDFTVGETITGGDTGVTATVYAIDTNIIDVTDRSGTFYATETLTGTTSAKTATYASTSQKPQVLEVSDNYSLLVATAGATMYLFMEDAPEAAAKDATLESLIDTMSLTNDNDRDFSVGLAQ